MIDSSSAYKLAVYGDTRRVVLRAVIDISSPDIVFGVVNSDGEDEFSVPGQVPDHVFEIVPYATSEWNRIILNGEFNLLYPRKTGPFLLQFTWKRHFPMY